MPLDSRTRATLRSAELGFLGVCVNTRVHTPRRWGAPLSAGVLTFAVLDWRPLRTSCWMVGTQEPRDRRVVDGTGRGQIRVDALADASRPTGHPRGRHAPAATCRTQNDPPGSPQGSRATLDHAGETCGRILRVPATTTTLTGGSSLPPHGGEPACRPPPRSRSSRPRR